MNEWLRAIAALIIGMLAVILPFIPHSFHRMRIAVEVTLIAFAILLASLAVRELIFRPKGKTNQPH
jgi:hypothetical protein